MSAWYSRLITNCPMLPADIAIIGGRLLPGQQAMAAVLQVTRPDPGDWFLCCLCGGQERFDRYVKGPLPGTHMATLADGLAVDLTPLGNATFHAALCLLSAEAKVYFYGINCTVGDRELQRRIDAAVAFVPAFSLLIFLGDMAGACDGRILPKLNLVGVTEMEPFPHEATDR